MPALALYFLSLALNIARVPSPNLQLLPDLRCLFLAEVPVTVREANTFKPPYIFVTHLGSPQQIVGCRVPAKQSTTMRTDGLKETLSFR